MKEHKQELKQELKKFEKFIIRDRERLSHAKNMVKTRRLVQMSYENEYNRQKENKRQLKLEATDVNDALKQA